MASSVRNGCGRLLVVCCVRVSMGWGTSFGSDLWHVLNLCFSWCYVTPRVTPFAQTHPLSLWVFSSVDKCGHPLGGILETPCLGTDQYRRETPALLHLSLS